MTSVVLDASALLAVAGREPGADVVRAVLPGAVMSAVNYSEVLKKAIERGAVLDGIMALARSASLEIVPFDEVHARVSAELYPHTKKQGMSFADRACLALGVTRKLDVMTAERSWLKVSLPIQVKLFRNAN